MQNGSIAAWVRGFMWVFALCVLAGAPLCSADGGKLVVKAGDRVTCKPTGMEKDFAPATVVKVYMPVGGGDAPQSYLVEFADGQQRMVANDPKYIKSAPAQAAAPANNGGANAANGGGQQAAPGQAAPAAQALNVGDRVSASPLGTGFLAGTVTKVFSPARPGGAPTGYAVKLDDGREYGVANSPNEIKPLAAATQAPGATANAAPPPGNGAATADQPANSRGPLTEQIVKNLVKKINDSTLRKSIEWQTYQFDSIKIADPIKPDEFTSDDNGTPKGALLYPVHVQFVISKDDKAGVHQVMDCNDYCYFYKDPFGDWQYTVYAGPGDQGHKIRH